MTSSTYRIERRIANTDQWNVIDHATSREDAIAKATREPRCDYAGVRIVPVTGDDDVDAYATPETVIGN